VMTGLVPAIQVFGLDRNSWMAGTSPAMTRIFGRSKALTRALSPRRGRWPG
jgi:hypothetical protein